MNFQTMANIFRGLAQTGAWGCFDEFNRISIEVLSVVATQVKIIQDCIKKLGKNIISLAADLVRDMIIVLAVVANREPEYQKLPAGLPPCKIGEFLFEGMFKIS
jgi:dynein heavy chain